MVKNDNNQEHGRHASEDNKQQYNPWVALPKTPELSSEALRIPEKIRERWLFPSEQILFVSCDVLLWTKFRPARDPKVMENAILMDTFGSGPSGMMQTVAMIPPAKQWTYQRVKWLVLTNERLLFLDHDSLIAQYQLDPELVRRRLSEWNEFQETLQSQQHDAQSLGWRQRYRMASAIRKEEANIANSEKVMTITKIEKKNHIFIRHYGIVRLLILTLVGIATSSYFHYDVNALYIILFLFFAIRIRPWSETLLTPCILIYNPRGKKAFALSVLRVQFNATSEAERFVSMIEDKVATLASVVSSS